MKKKIKLAILIFIKVLGGFHLARFLLRRKLRILCYHGFSIEDEHQFDDVLFIRKETFDRQMRLLKKWKLKVVSLQESVDQLPHNQHPDHATVLTFDDGWYSTLQALPVLRELNYPSTLYVATYYSLHSVSVFNVLIRYLFWKSSVNQIVLKGFSADLDGEYDLKRVIEVGNQKDRAGKQQLAAAIAQALQIDLKEIEAKRQFHYLSLDELRNLQASKMSIELHTHRHQLPLDQKQVAVEITDNRRILSQVRPGSYDHLCYPSGIYSEEQFTCLRELGIKSATISENHFNTPQTHLMKLDRFLSREKITDLEFEAEICGVTQLFKL